MAWALVKRLTLVLVVLLQIHGHRGCFEEERVGLLEFKAFLKSEGSVDTDQLLPSWVDDRESDCCGWERVTCNVTTRHAVNLSFNNTKQGSDGEVGTIWYLNVSLFQPFKELLSLNLSSNGFSGWIENEGFERLSILRNLETLNLDHNLFNNSILPSLSALTSLKTLSLGYNRLEGSFPAQELATLENLETLDLSGNGFNGTLTTRDSKSLSKLSKLEHLDLSWNYFNKEILRFLGAFSSLKSLCLKRNGMEGMLSTQDWVTFSNLEILDLSSNHLSGSIPPFMGTLSSLKALSLSHNNLNGSLPSQGLCELKKLQELDLSRNSFSGILPRCLKSLTSLKLLDLAVNQFTGKISSTALPSLTSLEYINLSHNKFKGSFSLSSFANHSKLEEFLLVSDDGEIEVETEHSGWVPTFQLKVLWLSNCKLNKLTGDIPKFLLNQYDLRVVDLSHNNLKGRFPNWLLENNTKLGFLNLRKNSFKGQLHLSQFPNINIYWVDVSDNQFDGHLQENMGEMVPHMVYLNLSRNTFEGSIMASICDMSRLEQLDLSSNNFSGEVPNQLISGCVRLSILRLSKNSFRGHIFSEHFNLTQLKDLRLDNNQFTGTLSSVISKCTQLCVLDISNNYMSGEIHSLKGNLTNLTTLIMRNNSFKGLFPCELFPLSFLDLSHNSFWGPFPHCSNLQYLKHIHLQENKFTGAIPKAIILNSSNLLTLDIRENFLSGSIPDLIGGLPNLRVLLLRGNHLSGLIPHQLCQLKKIGLMDLSRNSFSGPIPHCFNNFTFGKNGVSDHVFAQQLFMNWSKIAFYVYAGLLERDTGFRFIDIGYTEQDEVEFVTKYRPSAYKGDILSYMSGLDLSCNKLTGEIPHELGKLSWILALNLSHNQLTGSIPTAFSNLTQIESLDLSYNHLSGQIPSELIDLHFLAVFTVAHNNLSGRLLDMKGQFGTFENSSYDGNPFLCGPPLEKDCSCVDNSWTASSDESEVKWYEIDPVVFSASFAASYIIFLLGVATLLLVNRYWRQMWFNLIEECFYSCYYFVSNILHKLSACFYN